MEPIRPIRLSVCALVVTSLACNLQGGEAPAATELAETADAQVTAALAETQVAAAQTEDAIQAVPSETPTQAGTATETATITPTTIVSPFITTNVNSNVRGGPGTVYDIHGVLLQGQTADIVGRNNSSTWWVISFAAGPDGKGWISDSIVTVSGDTSNVPIVVAPPTPTPSPSGDWHGTWITNCGPPDCDEMTLTQDGETVTGTYASGSGSLSGSVDGDHFSGTWSRNNTSGTFDFWLAGNGEQWRGSYDKFYSWCGYREGEGEPSPCGVSAWYGTWTTHCAANTCGNLSISQDGTSVEGTYAGGDGTISGSVSGNKLTGTWFRNALSGSIEFYMLSDGDQFNGNYGGTSEWCGHRGGAGLPGQCLAP